MAAMTFARHFELNTIPDWKNNYVHYKELLELLNKAEEAAASPTPSAPTFDCQEFLKVLEAELKTVDEFRAAKEEELNRAQEKNVSLAKKSKGFAEVGRSLSKLVNTYDSWNKLKSYSVLNNQAFNELVQKYENLKISSPGGSPKPPAANFLALLNSSKIADCKPLEEKQAELEQKKLLGKGIISSGVRRPTKLEFNIMKSTKLYEQWVARQLPFPLVIDDIFYKHESMANDPFSFLRATFYRWVQLWPVICPGLSAAPHVLAVGDLHVENFGTWRDKEGRWVWGINDFDEAFPMAYTIDLVRLATSVLFLQASMSLKMSDVEILHHLLQGYEDNLTKGGCPIILAEKMPKLRKLALQSSKDPLRYWKNLQNVPITLDPVATDEVKEMLLNSAPEGTKPLLIAHRQAGLGSLGRPRFMLLGECQGGIIGRECKPRVPSACYFAANHPGPYDSRQSDIIRLAVRSPDPFFKAEEIWTIRRLSPESGRISFEKLALDEEQEIFYFMGWETANIHLGSKHAVENVVADLRSRPSNWLLNAALEMKHAIYQDFEIWRANFRNKPKPSFRSAL